MKDREYLIWLHTKLESLGVKPLSGYMHSLRALIVATPKERESINKWTGGNDMDGLTEILNKQKCSCGIFTKKGCLIHGK